MLVAEAPSPTAEAAPSAAEPKPETAPPVRIFTLDTLQAVKHLAYKDSGASLLESVVKRYIELHYSSVTTMENVNFPLMEPAEAVKCANLVFSRIGSSCTESANSLDRFEMEHSPTEGEIPQLTEQEAKEHVEFDSVLKNFSEFKKRYVGYLDETRKQLTGLEAKLKDAKAK